MTYDLRLPLLRRAATAGLALAGFLLTGAVLTSPASAVSFPDNAVEDGDAPHVVSIWRGAASASDSRLNFVCTGTLISPTRVLTAAHCVPPRNAAKKARVAIRVGGTSIQEADGEVVNVRGWFAHERYSAKRALNDVAILRLAKAVDVPVYGSITRAREDNNEPLTLMGWGEDQNGDVDGLNSVEQFSYTGDAREYFSQFNAKLQIAAGKWFEDEEVFGGSCRGDSGGPLFARGSDTRIVGIVSYGAPDCTLNVPGVYTRVGRFADWVERRGATLDKRFGLPGPVQEVKAVVKDGFVSLSWAAPLEDGGSPVTGYTVFMREDKSEQWKTVGTTRDTEYSIDGLEFGRSYEFMVVATNSSGQKPACGCVSAEMVEPQDVPGSPENLKVSVTATTVDLSWDRPNVLSGGKVDGYVVRYRQENGPNGPTKWVSLSQTKNTSVTVRNLPQKAELTFEVIAIGPGGESEPAVVSAATALPPDPPQDPRATSRTGDSITVSWDPPESDGGARITNYLVKVSRADGSVTPRTYTVPGNETSMTETGLRVNTKYVFEITAVNLAGSSRAVRLETSTATPPSAVQDASATSRGTSVKISWLTAPNDNGSPISQYELTWQEASGSGKGQTVCAAEARECIATGLRPATQYYFILTAVNLVGKSPETRVAARTAAAPSAPFRLTVVTGADSATLTWEAPESDGGEAVSDYTVVYATSSGSAQERRCGVVTRCVVTGLAPDTGYSFTVFAENSAGRGPGVSSSAKTASAPGVPSALRVVTETSNSAVLAWRAPTSDGGSPITHYQIAYWKVGEPQSAALTFDCPDAKLECTLPGLYRATDYRATVAAVNAAGVGPFIPSAPPVDLSALVETWPAPASVPLNVQYTAGSTQIILSWDAPEDTGGRSIIHYYVTVQRAGSSTFQTYRADTVKPLDHRVGGLSPSTEYVVKLYAYTTLNGTPVTMNITTGPPIS